jgi:hypothetical protein
MTTAGTPAPTPDPAHDPVHGLPDPSWTLEEARAWLLLRVDSGAACPLCTQFSKVYQRRINSAMTRGMIRLYVSAGLTFAHTPTLVRSHEFAQLQWWELIEEKAAVVDEGRTGFWRVTEKGRAWLREEIEVPKYARIYDQRLLGLTGDPIGVREALGRRHDLDELMEGA